MYTIPYNHAPNKNFSLLILYTLRYVIFSTVDFNRHSEHVQINGGIMLVTINEYD